MPPVAGADAAIRLADGPSPREGRAEVLNEGLWQPLCVEWDVREDAYKQVATVFCRQLGFPGMPGVRKENYFGSGARPRRWMACAGNESDLLQCLAGTDDFGDGDECDPMYDTILGVACAGGGGMAGYQNACK